MEPINTESNQQTEPALQPEQELNHSDKIVGVISEPKNIFETISHFPLKTIDWLLPLILVLVILCVTTVITMNNPEVKMKAKQQQEKVLNEMVAKGTITQEQADKQLDMMSGSLAIIFPIIGILIIGTIFFFIISAIYYLFAKAIFKDNGSFTSVLVANGLTGYIVIIQVIITAVLTIAFGRLMMDTSAAAFVEADRGTIAGFFLAKLDPFSIWAYAVVAIGLAKLFKSQSTGKYFAMVFGIWIIGGLILFYIGKAVPFLRFGS